MATLDSLKRDIESVRSQSVKQNAKSFKSDEVIVKATPSGNYYSLIIDDTDPVSVVVTAKKIGA